MNLEKEMTLTTMKDDFYDRENDQIAEWQDNLDHLEKMVQSAGDQIEQTYHDRVAVLKRYLQKVKDQLDGLNASDTEQWEEYKTDYQQSVRRYETFYGETLALLRKMPNRPAGWLAGFTDRPPAGSAGWLEGSNARAEGSEGWVEGMAKRTPESEGWLEGYKSE